MWCLIWIPALFMLIGVSVWCECQWAPVDERLDDDELRLMEKVKNE